VSNLSGYKRSYILILEKGRLKGNNDNVGNIVQVVTEGVGESEGLPKRSDGSVAPTDSCGWCAAQVPADGDGSECDKHEQATLIGL